MHSLLSHVPHFDKDSRAAWWGCRFAVWLQKLPPPSPPPMIKHSLAKLVIYTYNYIFCVSINCSNFSFDGYRLQHLYSISFQFFITVPSRNIGAFARGHSVGTTRGRMRSWMNSAGEYRYSVHSSPRLKFVYFTPKSNWSDIVSHD